MAGTLSVVGNILFDLIPAPLKLGGYRASLHVMGRRCEQSGGARVVALEPDPWVFKCLTGNLGRFPQTLGLPLALWNERATLNFFSAADKADSSLIEPDTPIRNVVETEAWPLDEVPEIVSLERKKDRFLPRSNMGFL